MRCGELEEVKVSLVDDLIAHRESVEKMKD